MKKVSLSPTHPRRAGTRLDPSSPTHSRRAGTRRLPVAEIIAVGSELLVGGRSDSNSLLITDELGALGIEVRFKSVVGDDEADIVRALKAAVSRAKVIVMTGGLGPTVDDCTRDAVAAASKS